MKMLRAAGLRQVHALVVAAEHDQRRLLAQQPAHRRVVRLDARRARETLKVQGMPISVSRKLRTPRA